MTKEDFKKIYEDKKTLINELLAINNQLDTLRTNINILIYNIFTNDRMKNIPAFDYQKAKMLSIDLGKLLNGTIQEYDLNKFQQNKNTLSEEKPSDKNSYSSFGGVYPSEYANPNSKYYEQDEQKGEQK